jgi:hypothetical protein
VLLAADTSSTKARVCRHRLVTSATTALTAEASNKQTEPEALPPAVAFFPRLKMGLFFQIVKTRREHRIQVRNSFTADRMIAKDACPLTISNSACYFGAVGEDGAAGGFVELNPGAPFIGIPTFGRYITAKGSFRGS